MVKFTMRAYTNLKVCLLRRKRRGLIYQRRIFNLGKDAKASFAPLCLVVL